MARPFLVGPLIAWDCTIVNTPWMKTVLIWMTRPPSGLPYLFVTDWIDCWYHDIRFFAENLTGLDMIKAVDHWMHLAEKGSVAIRDWCFTVGLW